MSLLFLAILFSLSLSVSKLLMPTQFVRYHLSPVQSVEGYSLGKLKYNGTDPTNSEYLHTFSLLFYNLIFKS